MTNKLKCPFCLQELKQNESGAYYCTTKWCDLWDVIISRCAAEHFTQTTQDMLNTAKILATAEKDLEIATEALKEMQHWLGVVRCSMISYLNNQNNTLLEHYETDPTVQNIDKAKSILKQYLEQIEHKE